MNKPADQQFQECVNDALGQAQVLIHQVINRVMDTFETHAIEAVTAKERQRYHDMLIELRRSKMNLSKSFLSQFTELVETSSNSKSPEHERPQPLVNLDNITLMDDDSMQEDVEVSQLIQQIESKAEWEIRDLNSRMSALKGTGVLDPLDNPMRPELFGRSLQRAVHAVPVGGEERMVLLRSFGSALSSALKDTYSSYSRKLQARNVQPMQYGVRSSRNTLSAQTIQAVQAALAQGGQQATVAHAASATTPVAFVASTNVSGSVFQPPVGAEHLQGYSPEQIERLMRGAQTSFTPPQVSTGAMQDGGPSSFFGSGSNDVLRGLLHQVVLANATQTTDTSSNNLITHFRDDLVAAAQRPIERLTIDVVAMMFDHILADVRLLMPVKAALGRLQIPVLRMALSDATLFSSRQHPTRRLINRVASYSLGYTQEADPNFALFLGVVNAEVEKLASDESEEPAHYTHALENIELVITQINQDSTRASEEAVKMLERAELRTVMRNSIVHHLATALASVEVDDYLRDFMRVQWPLVLVECIMQHGEEADQTRLLKQAASDLIWSVQPKVTSHDRRHLVKILPTLVRQIRDGLNMVEWTDYTLSDQQKFFAQLMTSHARAVKAEAPPKGTKPSNAATLAWQEKVAQAWGGTLELDSPAALGEVVVGADEKDATSLIDTADVTAMPASIEAESTTEGARAPSSAASHESSETSSQSDESNVSELDAELNEVRGHIHSLTETKLNIDQLEVGTWYEMKLRGQWNRVQLFWKSPKNLFFMFSSNIGGKSHSITRRALEKLCADNYLRDVESEGLIDRAVADVMASANAVKEGHSLMSRF